MKRLVSVIFVLSLIALTLPAFAQNETVLNVHVTRPVAIPGKILTPGNYVFRLQDEQTVPQAVQVTTATGIPVAGFIQVFESTREHAGNEVITASEPDSAGLSRINSFYFPGERYGYRFVYSKSDVRKLDRIAQKNQETATGM